MALGEAASPGGNFTDEGDGATQTAKQPRAGNAWSTEESTRLVENLRAGLSVKDLAALFGRTTGAIKARLARMIPAEEHVYRNAAAAWLLARFDVEPDYDWHGVLVSRLSQRRQNPATAPSGPHPSIDQVVTTRQAPAPRTGRTKTSASRVLAIWQDIVGAALQPARAEQFLANPGLPTMCRYPEDRILAAGTELYRRTRGLRIAHWVRECAWDGGGTASLTWDQVTSLSPDAAIIIRDLLTAAIGGLPGERTQRIVMERLGLHGEPARTLRAIGADLDITGERVRQIQERALSQLRRRHQPPKPAHYVGEILAAVFADATGNGADVAHTLVALVDAADHTGSTRVLVQILAALTGHSDLARKHLSAEVETLVALRRAELVRNARDAAAADRASERIGRMFSDVEWASGPAIVPDRSSITPQRAPNDQEGAGAWASTKLARAVSYESTGELRIIKTLDQARQIQWFCEQPVAIGYTLDGRHRTYYPDLMAVTDDGRCVLIEVKAQTDMATAINQTKMAAARAFCTRHGWGYLCTDGYRSFQELQKLPIPESAAQVLTDALSRERRVMWADTAPIRAKYGITSLHIAALVVRRGWDLRLGPYRITESADQPETSSG
jgi:hypothetical protein